MADLTSGGFAPVRRRVSTAGALLGLAFVALLLAPGSASAATTYSHLGQFGGTGTAGQPGLFHNTTAPQRMAVHQGSGKLFVADRGNNRVQVFNPTVSGADFAYQISVSAPVGVAIDQDSGDLFVTNATAIAKFNPDSSANPTAYSADGTFTSPAIGAGVGQIGALQSGINNLALAGGIAVDPLTGDILVADVGRHLIQRFDSDGVYVSSFNGAGGGRPAFTGIKNLAVTSTGDIVVADVSGELARVDRFSGVGVLQATLSQSNSPVPNPSVGVANGGMTVAVNEVDEVFVSSVSTNSFAPSSPVSQVYQFENDVNVANFTAPANFAGVLYGMVGSEDPARLYVMAGHQFPAPLFGVVPIPRVQVFRSSVAPTATLGDPADVAGMQATFNGSVNPQGGATDWRFEYRRVGTIPWTPFPVPNGNAGGGTGDVSVQTTATGLEPNTDYEVRLLAIKGDVVVVAENSPKTFRTASVPAVIDTAIASFLNDATATLTGGVNPRNAQTDYWFEYGTDTNYGQVAPADPVNAGSGATRVAVAQPIAGLQPDTTYHFRIVAENEFGQQSFGDDLTFTTFATARGGIGPKRAYELATKLPVLGIPIATAGVDAAENGDDVMYRTSDTNPLHPGYDLPYKLFHSSRGDTGWTVGPIDLPNPAATLTFFDPVVMSSDFSRGVATSTASHHPDDQNGVIDLYLRQPDDSLTWISRAEDAVLAEPEQPQTDAALVEQPVRESVTRDGTTVVFRSQRRLLDEDTNPSGAQHRLYKWSRGELSLVSVRPDGSVPANATLGNFAGYPLGALSSDGTRVFWSDATTIYANVDGVSKTVGAGTYAGASTDGARVIYTAGGRLYSFDVDAEVAHDLTGAVQVQGVTAVSQNGLRIYFVANAQLDAEPSPLGRVPSPSGRNLYMIDVDEGGVPQRTRLITALDAADTGTWDTGSISGRTVDMSRDGSVLAFGSVANLVGKPTGGNRQLYVYDSDAHSLSCASCPADGSSPGPGHVNADLSSAGFDTATVGTWSRRQVSTDGTVFFSTRTALTSEDQNSARDVYEYRNGEVRLVTRGAWDDSPTALAAASVDGRTVFFYTSEALVSRDYEDGVTKLYAARVGGGFADQSPEPGCVGDACQGSGTPAPDLDVPGSERFSGSGDVSDPRRPVTQLRLAVIGRSQARSLARGRRIAVAAVVPAAGRVTAEVRARLRRGGPLVRIGAVAVRAPRAGRVRIGGLRLQPRALRVLRRQGSLRAQVVVRQGGRASSRALRLSRPAGRNANR